MIKKIRIVFVLLIIIAFIFLLSYRRGINKPVSNNTDEIVFVIEKGESINQIVGHLDELGLIRSENHFSIYSRLHNKSTKFQAGKYILSQSYSTKEIIKMMTIGNTIGNEKEIKVLEGWTTNDIAQYFETNGLFQREEFFELVGFPRVDYRKEMSMLDPKDYSDEYSFLRDKPEYYGMEGYLFPDTYRIFNDATLEDIVEKMLDNFDTKLTSEMREDIEEQGKTIYDIITIASIIEKEVREDSDKKIVSGILYKRLTIGMKLQIDSTINYITGNNDPSVTIKDTNIDSEYNTYKYYGLPIGPISNPGIESIKAAIYPTSSEYLFYLNRQDTGETIFSRTYLEHLDNKNKYLK